MVYSVFIEDNKNSPIHYLSDLKAFKNGTEYIFNPGVIEVHLKENVSINLTEDEWGD